MTVNLDGSPYSLEDTGRWVFDKVNQLQDRVDLLREQGQLSEQTLRAYFGDTRFRQIAESNAIEGSTLDVGETQMAVLRGITITGHDPAYSKDAVNLSKALERMVELAQDGSPTSLDQVKEPHALILGNSQARVSSAPNRSGSGDQRTALPHLGTRSCPAWRTGKAGPLPTSAAQPSFEPSCSRSG